MNPKMAKNKKQFKKNLIKKRILWFLVGIILLELLLRFSGFVYIEIQYYKNKNSGEAITNDAYRILCLGESTTAISFNLQSSWPAELEQILNNRSSEIKFKVFNDGIPGIDSTYILNNLEENLRKHNPDMVIAMMGINDFRIKEESTKKNKLISFFMKLKVVKLFDLICSHWYDKIKNIKINIYKKVFKKSSDVSLKKDAPYYDLFYHTQGRENREEMLKKAVELNPKDYMAYVQLGAFYHTQNKLEKAEEMLKKAVELNPENDRAYVGLGLVYKEQNMLKKAEEMFEKAIERNPDDGRVYLELGRTYFDQGRFKEAEEMFKKTIEKNQDNEWAYLDLGQTYKAQGRFEEAEGMFKKAIEKNQDNEEIYLELGRTYFDQGRFKEAEEMFKKTIEKNQDNEWAYLDLGQTYKAQGRFEEAEGMFKKIIERDPDNEWIYLELEMLYNTQGKFKEAEDMFKKAIEINPDNGWPYLGLGWAYYNQDKVKEAEDTFKQGIKLNPYNEEADSRVKRLYFGLGFLYKIQDKFDEAEDLFNKLSKIEKSDLVSSENYQRMYKRLKEKGIKFVVVQYPTKNIDEKKVMFDKSQQKDIIFISNEENFRTALKNVSSADYFIDMFAGNFGHCTLKGNRLIAKNVADVIMAELRI